MVNLIAEITGGEQVPANRAIDHIRRIVTAATIGAFFATVFAFIIFAEYFRPSTALWALVPFALLTLALVVVWKIIPEPSTDPIPAVGRTLATAESVEQRYLRSGAARGLLVPVIAAPVTGSPFRAVVLIKEERRGQEISEPPVGTLLYLEQVEAGLAQLRGVDTPSAEQEELFSRLQRHPRQLSNRAPALPSRRGPLERTPWWAGLQWWAAIFVSAMITYLFIWMEL